MKKARLWSTLRLQWMIIQFITYMLSHLRLASDDHTVQVMWLLFSLHILNAILCLEHIHVPDTTTEAVKIPS